MSLVYNKQTGSYKSSEEKKEQKNMLFICSSHKIQKSSLPRILIKPQELSNIII